MHQSILRVPPTVQDMRHILLSPPSTPSNRCTMFKPWTQEQMKIAYQRAHCQDPREMKKSFARVSTRPLATGHHRRWLSGHRKALRSSGEAIQDLTPNTPDLRTMNISPTSIRLAPKRESLFDHTMTPAVGQGILKTIALRSTLSLLLAHHEHRLLLSLPRVVRRREKSQKVAQHRRRMESHVFELLMSLNLGILGKADWETRIQ